MFICVVYLGDEEGSRLKMPGVAQCEEVIFDASMCWSTPYAYWVRHGLRNSSRRAAGSTDEQPLERYILATVLYVRCTSREGLLRRIDGPTYRRRPWGCRFTPPEGQLFHPPPPHPRSTPHCPRSSSIEPAAQLVGRDRLSRTDTRETIMASCVARFRLYTSQVLSSVGPDRLVGYLTG